MSTASGTNEYHGAAYAHRGTNWINAAPFFFNQDPDIPANDKVPQLHRYILGGTFGGPIIKDKLFGFVAYQHLHVSDQEIGDSFLDVPVGLSDDRSASGLATVTNNSFCTPTTRQLRLHSHHRRQHRPARAASCSIHLRFPANPANG